MPMKLRSTVAAATLLFGMTAAMAQSNEHNLVVAQNVQKGRQGPPAAAVSRPAAPVRVAPSIQATPRIQAAPRVVTPSRQVIAPAPRIIQRQTTGQGEVRRNTFTGTTRTTTGAGTANTRV